LPVVGGAGQLGTCGIYFCTSVLLSKGRKAGTMRNLNIKSDEAYELAHFVAERKGQSMTAVVVDLLQREKRALTKVELKEKWMQIAAENRRKLDPEFLNWDYNADLYDELGLPK
jgi:hypothetical protein